MLQMLLGTSNIKYQNDLLLRVEFVFLQGLVAGIVNGGTGDCNINQQWPNVYTDVFHFRKWINATMNELEDN